jgi:ABC-type multidrug transport system ATPase subunit
MLRRVGIAQALLADPDVLIVDEPTAGLDPEERVRFRNLLSELAATRIVVLSTHIVSDVESVSNDIAIVAEGRLRRRGAPEQLLSTVAGQVWELMVEPALVDVMRTRFVVSRMIRTRAGMRVRVLSPTPPGPDATPVSPDLEDVYLAVIQASPRSAVQAQEVGR